MGYTKKQNSQGDTECRICPQGTYQPDEDGAHCLPCPKGYYSNRRGSVRCIRCPENAWTPTSGQSLSIKFIIRMFFSRETSYFSHWLVHQTFDASASIVSTPVNSVININELSIADLLAHRDNPLYTISSLY